MEDAYGMKEFKELLEKAFVRYQNEAEAPFPLVGYEAQLYVEGGRSTLQWVLEMFPEIKAS